MLIIKGGGFPKAQFRKPGVQESRNPENGSAEKSESGKRKCRKVGIRKTGVLESRNPENGSVGKSKSGKTGAWKIRDREIISVKIRELWHK